ncbi:MAG: dihydroneopterin aldolase, partial [Fibromonadaceae bacterium]|nr:dihydroneopterin aldolase [Fibromonadaceae bacterium]
LCETFIGIYPEELHASQKVEFGYSFEYDCKQAVETDSIDNAVDYAILTEELKTFVSNSKFNLLETLGANIAKKILAFSPKVSKVKVYCVKLNELKPRVDLCLEK